MPLWSLYLFFSLAPSFYFYCQFFFVSLSWVINRFFPVCIQNMFSELIVQTIWKTVIFSCFIHFCYLNHLSFFICVVEMHLSPRIFTIPNSVEYIEYTITHKHEPHVDSFFSEGRKVQKNSQFSWNQSNSVILDNVYIRKLFHITHQNRHSIHLTPDLIANSTHSHTNTPSIKKWHYITIFWMNPD